MLCSPSQTRRRSEIAVTAEPNSQPGSYVLTGGQEGKQRLNLLADILRPTTLRLLGDAGLRSGDRCLDLGCGGGDVTLDIARAVGPEGSVTGVDSDPRIAGLAREDARRAGAANTDFRVADVHTFEGGPFDLVYCRLLLGHLSDPADMLTRMRRLAGPGGRVVIEEMDVSGWYSYPHDPANARFEELYTEVVRLGGGDADIGRRLPVIALAAGLGDLHCTVFQPAHVSGPYKRMAEMTMERIRPALLRYGLATDGEIGELLVRMRAFAENPSTLLAFPRIVQVWGTA
jgi:SAM-dependent methyltransferase